MVLVKLLLEKMNNSCLLWIIKIAATAAVVYLVNKSLAHGQIQGLLGQVAPAPVAVALLLAAAGFYLQTQRWRSILQCMGIRIDTTSALQTMFWGNLLAFLTPGRAGELLRGTTLPASRKRDTVYAVMIDKGYAGGVALATGVACTLAATGLSGIIERMQWLLIVCSSAILIAGIAVIIVIRYKQRFQPFARLFSLFNVRSIVPIVLYSAAAHALLLIESAVLLSMFGSPHFLWNLYTVAQAYAFMIFFPFFIANMGIREYSFGLFLGYLRPGSLVVPAVAFGASMGILVINIILPAAIGLVWWLWNGNREK